MIANERQYRIAGAQLRRFEEALAARAASEPGGDIAPLIFEAMADAIASEHDELRAQLARYEDLRSGRVTHQGLCSLRGLPVTLIEGRIAARMTQRDLAERLGIPEQQVQRWETKGYVGVALERLQGIADALGLRMCGTVTLTSRSGVSAPVAVANRERLDVAAEEYLTPAQVAAELQVTVVTVRRWIAHRELRAMKAGPRRWTIRRSDLNAYLAAGRQSDVAVEVSEDPSFGKYLVAPDEH